MFKLDFEWRRWFSMMLVGLIQYAEGLEKKTDLSEEEGILPADEFCLWTQITALFLPWVSSLLVYSADFGYTVHFHSCVNQFLKISLSLGQYLHVLLVPFLWELWLIHHHTLFSSPQGRLLIFSWILLILPSLCLDGTSYRKSSLGTISLAPQAAPGVLLVFP